MNANFQLLIVDDDEEFLDILERRFSRRGYLVAACSSFESAVEIAGKQRFDVAVIDRSIPGGSDLELLARLKVIDSQLPIIVLSGWSGPTFADEALGAGASEYLCKPCSLNDVDAALQRALATHPALDRGRSCRRALARPPRRFTGICTLRTACTREGRHARDPWRTAALRIRQRRPAMV